MHFSQKLAHCMEHAHNATQHQEFVGFTAVKKGRDSAAFYSLSKCAEKNIGIVPSL